MKILELSDNYAVKRYVNVAHIVQFYRNENDSYTRVELVNGEHFLTKEAPQSISAELR